MSVEIIQHFFHEHTLVADAKLTRLVGARDHWRNSILCNWSYLKENLNPIHIMDDLLGVQLVDEDRADIINDEKFLRRKQVDLTLRNVVRRIDQQSKFDEFISILRQSKNKFIADQLQKEKTYGEKQLWFVYVFRIMILLSFQNVNLHTMYTSFHLFLFGASILEFFVWCNNFRVLYSNNLRLFKPKVIDLESFK